MKEYTHKLGNRTFNSLKELAKVHAEEILIHARDPELVLERDSVADPGGYVYENYAAMLTKELVSLRIRFFQ